MIIQNFYSDVLLSLLHLFEDYLFDNKNYFFTNQVQDSKPHSFFKFVQFNIGNRNYQIGDYKEAGQLEFPTGIFTYVSDETAWGKANDLIGHHRIWDVNEIICTHNKNTNINILCREEQQMIYATVQINCASMAQANEVMHQIKRFLPVQKFIQIFPFESFMEIPPIFFHTKYNNPDLHDIDNLFLRYNGSTGEKVYYYKCYYRPHIQLNSVSADLSDNAARSYPVTCDFSYLIQAPIWLFDTYSDEHIERVNLGIQSSDNISSVIVDNTFLTTTDNSLEINGIYYISREQYIIDKTSENFKNERIIIPKPVSLENDVSNSAAGKENQFIISISKLFPRKSTVVSYIGANLPKIDFYNSLTKKKQKTLYDNYEVNILNTFKLEEQEDYLIDKDNITIFVHDKDHLKPDLSSPIIITILQPKSDEELETILNKKKFLSKNIFFEIKEPQKKWFKI